MKTPEIWGFLQNGDDHHWPEKLFPKPRAHRPLTVFCQSLEPFRKLWPLLSDTSSGGHMWQTKWSKHSGNAFSLLLAKVSPRVTLAINNSLQPNHINPVTMHIGHVHKNSEKKRNPSKTPGANNPPPHETSKSMPCPSTSQPLKSKHRRLVSTRSSCACWRAKRAWTRPHQWDQWNEKTTKNQYPNKKLNQLFNTVQ